MQPTSPFASPSAQRTRSGSLDVNPPSYDFTRDDAMTIATAQRSQAARRQLAEAQSSDHFEHPPAVRRPSADYLQAQADLARASERLDRMRPYAQPNRSSEMRRSYDRARAVRDAQRRSRDDGPARDYQERLDSAQGPTSDAALTETTKRGPSSERRSGDQMSDGSGREPLSMDQLAHASEYGGLRTRSRAEVQKMIYERAHQPPAEEIGPRAYSAPAQLPESSDHGSRRPSQTVINLTLANDVRAVHSADLDAVERGESRRTITRNRTQRFTDAMTPDVNSAKFKYSTLILQSVVTLVLGVISVFATYMSTRNRASIESNDQRITDLMGPAPGPS